MAKLSLPKSNSKFKRCSIHGCLRQHDARGYCKLHYRRWRQHGNPNTVLTPPRITKEIFWSRVAITADIERCWEWQGHITYNGYGSVSFEGRNEYTHRLAWFLTHDEWPKDHCLHRCDNRICVNPRHLFNGTNLDNIRDKVNKGRQSRGESHGMSLLTATDVIAIRQKRLEGATLQSLAREYGVSVNTIGYIARHILWRHVRGQETEGEGETR